MIDKPFTDSEKKVLDDAEFFLNRLYSRTGRMLNNVYYNISQPLIENPIAKTIQKVTFHTTAGRSALVVWDKLNASIGSMLNYLFALRFNSAIDFMLDDLGRTANGIITVTVIIFVLVVLHALIDAVSKKIIDDQTNGRPELFEETFEDLMEKSKKQKRKI